MHDQISPELALVDPDLATRARAMLPDPHPAPRRAIVRSAPPPASATPEKHYPAWARITAALWLLVLGILVGGAAIPHAQDRPRVIPKDEDPSAVCTPSKTPSSRPPPFITPGR